MTQDSLFICFYICFIYFYHQTWVESQLSENIDLFILKCKKKRVNNIGICILQIILNEKFLLLRWKGLNNMITCYFNHLLFVWGLLLCALNKMMHCKLFFYLSFLDFVMSYWKSHKPQNKSNIFFVKKPKSNEWKLEKIMFAKGIF